MPKTKVVETVIEYVRPEFPVYVAPEPNEFPEPMFVDNLYRPIVEAFYAKQILIFEQKVNAYKTALKTWDAKRIALAKDVEKRLKAHNAEQDQHIAKLVKDGSIGLVPAYVLEMKSKSDAINAEIATHEAQKPCPPQIGKPSKTRVKSGMPSTEYRSYDTSATNTVFCGKYGNQHFIVAHSSRVRDDDKAFGQKGNGWHLIVFAGSMERVKVENQDLGVYWSAKITSVDSWSVKEFLAFDNVVSRSGFERRVLNALGADNISTNGHQCMSFLESPVPANFPNSISVK